jgi:hypothetical protein
MIVNELTGEVTAEIGGKTFRLHATIERMAALEAELGVPNVAAIARALQDVKASAIRTTLRNFCTSGNSEAFSGMAFGRVALPAIEACMTAINAAMPEPDAKNVEAPMTRKRRGRDTGK